MREMADKARRLGGDAVVGVDLDYVTAAGTAVRLD